MSILFFAISEGDQGSSSTFGKSTTSAMVIGQFLGVDICTSQTTCQRGRKVLLDGKFLEFEKQEQR